MYTLIPDVIEQLLRRHRIAQILNSIINPTYTLITGPGRTASGTAVAAAGAATCRRHRRRWCRTVGQHCGSARRRREPVGAAAAAVAPLGHRWRCCRHPRECKTVRLSLFYRV